MNDEPLVLYVTLCALNLAERGAPRAPPRAARRRLRRRDGPRARAQVGALLLRRAYELAPKNDKSLRALILAHEGYYEAGIGRFGECRAHLEESIELYERIGDARLGEESISILAYARFYEGALERSLELYDRLQRSGEERGDAQITGWGLANRIKVHGAHGTRTAKSTPP